MSDLDVAADRPWTAEAVQQLRELALEKVPAEIISLKLKRSLAACRRSSPSLGLRSRRCDADRRHRTGALPLRCFLRRRTHLVRPLLGAGLEHLGRRLLL